METKQLKYTSYMYFAHNNTIAPLFNSKYKIYLPNNKSIVLLPEDERLLVGYWYYRDDKEAARKSICTWLNNHFSNLPYHLQDYVIDKFMEDHPAKQTDIVQEIPCQAINGLYTFHVPSIDEKITITEKEEKELIEIIKVKKGKAKSKVVKWFVKYYDNHGENPMSFYSDIEIIAKEFIAGKGYILEEKTNILAYFVGLVAVGEIIFFIFLAIVFIMFVFTYLKLIFFE